MATTAPRDSPKFSFFHMDMQSTLYGPEDEVPPTVAMPISDKNLVFVHLNEVTGPTQDVSTRHKVRAHVMRDFQRKKHKNAKPNKSNKRPILPNHDASFQSSTFEGTEEADSKLPPNEQATQIQETTVLARLPDPQVIGMLEPFNVLPISGSPRLQLLVHHYNTYLINTLIPVNPKDKWFNYALTDPAMFHATIMHAAMHQRVVNGGTDHGEQVQLKRDTIKMVTQRLEDPVLSRSDFTIGAVVCLVLLEVRLFRKRQTSNINVDQQNQEGNLELSNIHMSGLQKMIALRGGVEKLGLAGVLRRKILWGDLLNVTLSGGEPRFNMAPTIDHPLVDFVPFTTVNAAVPNNNAFDSIQSLSQGSCTCSIQFSTILASLRKISSQSNLEGDVTGSLSDGIYLAERHLFYLLKNMDKFSTLHSPTCSSLGAACFIATQMYLYHTLRDFPFEVPIFQTFLQRLNVQLWDESKESVSIFWQGKEQMLLWVLTLGALSSVGDSKLRYIYTEKIRQVCRIMNVTHLEELTSRLSGVVWRDSGRDLNLVGLWNEVQGGLGYGTLGLEVLVLGRNLPVEANTGLSTEYEHGS
ncbi:hypothetical protein VTL71DRAFT_9359 [Oculimacula yallundae]|uniref:Transcription factor domain-containing protein n=1 Tax=Oculimacula yallundae TaxID=86028 RepID=A0ABR4BSU1_9HELO